MLQWSNYNLAKTKWLEEGIDPRIETTINILNAYSTNMSSTPLSLYS